MDDLHLRAPLGIRVGTSRKIERIEQRRSTILSAAFPSMVGMWQGCPFALAMVVDVGG
ncbi:hypothetical protein NKJ90_23140 [Mesorhizobium sp. M0051]|uniref:hypothetical protein n=1 Tax=Mesorhizobium sp. M0051 TaxID=2956862 RepID=UPI00333DF0D0